MTLQPKNPEALGQVLSRDKAFTQFHGEESRAAKALLDALILEHQARKWVHAP